MMMRRSLALLGMTILFLNFFQITSAFAVQMTSLYRAELAVPAQTDDLKEQAIKDGFFQVLVKLSGNPDIAKNSEIKANLSRADYYVQDLSYSLPTPSSSEYLLQIHYSERDVDRLLQRAGVAYWDKNRPLILVWLAVTDKKKSTDIIGNEMPGDVLTMVQQAGRKFGLPLIFPMMDVADISQVSPVDVTAVVLPVLQAAAKRYAPDALLIGRLVEKPGGYQSSWQLVINKNHWYSKVAGKTADDVIAAAMNQVSQTLAKQSVSKTTMQPPEFSLKLEVMNITENNDLSQLMAYLKKVALIKQVKLLQVSGDVAELSLLVSGNLPQFLQKVAGPHLVLKYHDTADNRLGYVWVH